MPVCRLRLFALLFLLALSSAAPAAAQWPPDSIYNLQVLPKNTPLRELVGTMRGFASALGVRCIYCHVGDDPNNLATTEFSADDLLPKRKAREMIKMVQQINGTLLASVPERSDPPVEVTCTTCHRGVTQPRDIRDILATTLLSQGVDSTIAEYERLKAEYLGRGSYDFSPFMLANVAEKVLTRRNGDMVLQLMEYNVKQFPADQQTWLTMGQIHMARADTAATIRVMERAVAQNPENQFFKQMLARIKPK